MTRRCLRAACRADPSACVGGTPNPPDPCRDQDWCAATSSCPLAPEPDLPGCRLG